MSSENNMQGNQKLFGTKPRLRKRLMKKIRENRLKITIVVLASALILVIALSASLLQDYRQLSSDVDTLNSVLLSYSAIPEACPRAINKKAIDGLNLTVFSITGDVTGSWLPYQRIYEFIVSNITGIDDVDMPYISQLWHFDFLWSKYNFKMSTSVVRNYVQTPALTLQLKQGDCDDQAVLAFAMMKSYMRSVVHTDYRLYLATMLLSDGTEHVFVIFPAGAGNLSIIDPAGHYITASNDTMDFKNAYSEFQTYNLFWQSHFNATIQTLTIFEVNPSDGNYQFIDHGTISQIAARF
ncbi:MAG: hypothetical protein LUP94_02100 [Candidatus Methanomethylicus sp.]|nr:hypothetical protein [Candidatus Methanomethylicus sp.]